MDEPKITLTMARADWKLFRNALQEYIPDKKDRPRYNDLYGWIVTDWDDYSKSKHKSHIKTDIELCITCACGTPQHCQYDCAHNKPCYYYPKKELK